MKTRMKAKTETQYSLFESTPRPGKHRNWHSLSDMAFPLAMARVVFQDALLAAPNRELRPIKKHQTVKIRFMDERVLGQ